MAHTALPAPRTQAAPRRRVFFGLFDADGWAWASVKAVFWFVVIIVMLGYLPDRAYYFTVERTIELGKLLKPTEAGLLTPVNLCPPSNETLPCPVPAGANLPWHPSPPEIQMPAGRTAGVAAVLGQTYFYVGGSDGTSPVDTVFVTRAVGDGNLDKWSAGPSLPEARSDAASAVLGNTLYVIGGYGPDGKPTSTVFGLTVETDGTFGEWTPVEALALPQPRAGGSAVAVSDGLVVMGGTNGDAAARTVWKVQQDAKSGKFSAWADQAPLLEANVDGLAVLVGEVIFLIGGRDDTGRVVPTVQLGIVGGDEEHPAPDKDPNAIALPWRASEQTNLPGARTNLSGFTANGAVYVQGGSDGSVLRSETAWATPNAEGVIEGWKSLAQTSLGSGIEGAAAVVSGPHAFIFGGRTDGGVTSGAARAYLAPQAPFFQLGVLGATVPALALSGEIGQQIGYLNAALVGTVNFVLLLLIGWAFAHQQRVRSMWGAWRARRAKR
jgi:N-acetylneuraminic acid mutarotase